MKATKKIVGAACALVAAVALSAGSTFAWFAMNDTVTATNMQIQATTASNLAISADGTNFGTTMDLATKNNSGTVSKVLPVTVTKFTTVPTASLSGSVAGSPVTMSEGESIAFYTINEANKIDDPNSADATVTMATAITESTVTTNFTKDTGDNYISDDMWLLYTDASTPNADIDLVMTVKGTQAEINKALHIGFIKDGKWYNYDLSTVSESYDGGKYTFTLNDFINLTSGTSKKISIYAWYEGEDSDCTTNNALSNILQIDLEYTISQGA